MYMDSSCPIHAASAWVWLFAVNGCEACGAGLQQRRMDEDGSSPGFPRARARKLLRCGSDHCLWARGCTPGSGRISDWWPRRIRAHQLNPSLCCPVAQASGFDGRVGTRGFIRRGRRWYASLQPLLQAKAGNFSFWRSSIGGRDQYMRRPRARRQIVESTAPPIRELPASADVRPRAELAIGPLR